ncbi:MAG: helix-turn-helix domain-containing protein [Pseudomonadota bacterium]
MTDGEPETDAPAVPLRAGQRLRAARQAQGLEISDIAARTRIPQRHLESIEAGNYGDLPSVTYAMGFARAYARAVGVDEVGMAAEVRAELGSSGDRPRPSSPAAYDIADPAHTPSRGLVWGGVLVALLVLVGIGLWYGTDLFRGGTAPATQAVPGGGIAVPIPETVAPAPAAGPGQVVITATDEVWVRIYDRAGTTLLMKTMAPGERYEVPGDADGPMINVGRPDKLAVTVNGAAVAPLGDGKLAIRDVGVGAAALLARGAAASPTPTPTPSPTTTPAGRAVTTPAARPSPRAPAPTPSATPSPRPFEPVFGNSATPN